MYISYAAMYSCLQTASPDTGCTQDFAEKPKGEALKAMQVDTTALGLDAER